MVTSENYRKHQFEEQGNNLSSEYNEVIIQFSELSYNRKGVISNSMCFSQLRNWTESENTVGFVIVPFRIEELMRLSLGQFFSDTSCETNFENW